MKNCNKKIFNGLAKVSKLENGVFSKYCIKKGICSNIKNAKNVNAHVW
jgi:hypothetical protein